MIVKQGKPLVLIVDDTPENIQVLIGALEDNYELGVARSGSEALGYIKEFQPELILLDIIMPGMDGYEVLTRLKKNSLTRDIPIIFISALSEIESKTKGFELGVVDYIERPFEFAEVRARVKTHIMLRQARELLKNQNQFLEDKVMERTRQLENVLNMSLLLNSERDFGRLFQLVITQTSKILEVERSTLYLIDHRTGKLWTRSPRGYREPMSIPRTTCLPWRVVDSGKPAIINNAEDHPHANEHMSPADRLNCRSVLCYPIRNREKKMLGVIEVINKTGGRIFNLSDKSLAAVCAAQIGVTLETFDLVTELRKAFESFARTLITTIEAKHPLTAGHSHRVTEYSLFMGREMGLKRNALEMLKYACLLHDVGKIGVPDKILAKRGNFDREERRIMKKHAAWTFRILEEIKLPRMLKGIPKMAACHHEKMDGTGYPYGLKGEEIPFFSRIMSVADVFDALTSSRDYPKYDGDRQYDKDPISMNRAFGILKRDKSSHFDPEVIEVALSSREKLEDLREELHLEQKVREQMNKTPKGE